MIELQHIHRQEDEAFKSILNAIRGADQTQEQIDILNEHAHKTFDNAITLVTTNADADFINKQALMALQAEEYHHFADTE